MSELNTAAIDENLLPGGVLVTACRYALNLRTQLRRSLENGVTEIDNNRCEQKHPAHCVRPEELAAHRCPRCPPPSVAAIISVVESCKRMGIIVRGYLSDVLPRLAAAHPDQVAALAATLTPVRWLAASATAAAAPAENPE